MNDTLIAIVTCPAYAPRVKDQLYTWIPDAVAAGYDVKIFDGERLGVPDDYSSLPLKTKALCAWALANGYKRLLKLDDDAYVCVERFKVVDADYAGILCSPNDGGNPVQHCNPLPPGTTKFCYASGGAYWLSERSMQLVADATPTDWAEDRWVGQILGAAGIKFTRLSEYGVHGYPSLSGRIVMTQLPDRKAIR